MRSWVQAYNSTLTTVRATEEEYTCYLDLVVTAIGADSVPITGKQGARLLWNAKAKQQPLLRNKML